MTKWLKGYGAKLGLREPKRAPDGPPETLPKAPPPPYVMGALEPVDEDDIGVPWSSTCRGGRQGRCGVCPLCEWEKLANRWHQLSPWFPELKPEREENSPRWPSVYAALRALAEHELHGRHAPSPLGAILDNLRTGAIRLRRAGTTYRRDREDPIMRRASEVAEIARAVDAAYYRNRWAMDPDECGAMLLMSIDGVVPYRITSEVLGKLVDMQPWAARAVVRHGVTTVTVELAARDLIPEPAPHFGLAEAIHRFRLGLRGERCEKGQ